MKTRGRGADNARLDYHSWVVDTPSRDDPRPARRDRRAAPRDRRSSSEGKRRSASGERVEGRGVARDERRAATRRSDHAERRSTSAKRPATAGERPHGAERGGGRATSEPAGALLAPGVAERRAVMLVTMLLLLYGLVMAYSASSAEAFFEYGSSFHFVGRQLAFALLGLAAMWTLARVDYAWYRRLAYPFAGLALAALTLVLVPGIGMSVNGARRWIVVGGLSLQPSELAKIAAVMLVATLIVRRPNEITRLGRFLLLAGVGIVPAAGLIMLEPDLGTTLVLVFAVLATLIAGGARLRHLAVLIIAGILAVLVLIVIEPYRLVRLSTFFDPWSDPQGTGFQATQSLISVASGGLFGVGLGNSVQKFGFLPEQGTDMITGIIGEELGLVGILALVAMYAALAWFGFRIAIDCRELFGKLLATGITVVIIGQASINISAALGILPLTGIPLPLVSLGGTSLVVVLAGLGILLNIATNRRSFIVASPQRSARSAGRGGDRRSSAAGPRRRG